jgi:CheY-like chemotaxis protein
MESDQGPNSSGCVLVAEDNKTNQLIARSLLQQANIASIIASDGQNAVELFKKNQETVALVLMDLHMPVMNGYDAAREIRTLDPNIPIVAMTADVILGVKEKCAECGIHHYLSKPYDPDQFLSTVRNLMQKPPTISNGAPLLDIPRGLKNLGEDNELYRQVLAEYAQENRHILEDLTSLIRDKQYIEAARVIHKAKGSSGSIGAKKIYELAIELQKVLELQQEPEIRVLYEDFHGTFKRLLAEITGYLATQDHPK